jgi:cell division protein FtsW
MTAFSRTDTSVLGRWWWTVDRFSLIALVLLCGIGAILTMAAGPSAAARIGLEPFHFVRHQFAFLLPALLLLIGVSLLSPLALRRVATIGLMIGLVLLLWTLFGGADIKGATRWITLAGITVQPSEFVKPCLAVVAAWMLAEHKVTPSFPGHWIAATLYMMTIACLVMQPDIGMTLVVLAVGFAQFFLAGMPILLALLGLLAAFGAIGAGYFLLPHMTSRIDRYLHPEEGDTYQVDTSLNAFHAGGLFGRGPGEGVVKALLPDAHTDFIFAVAGEEFGLLACLLIIALFAFIVLRGLNRTFREGTLFATLAATGLLSQFGLQALINMGVTVRLLPAKGMTLPFISYGGSSLIASALAMGLLLALTRRRTGDGALP